VCLSLTKLVAPSSCLTSVLGARRIDHWEYKDLVSGSGGILIGFNSSSYILIDKWVGGFSLSVVLMGRKDSFIQAITSVYGLSRRNLRLFSSKGFFILNKDGLYPGLLEGISMLSISLTNEKGGEGNDHDRQDFNSLIDQAELVDLSIADRSFTWSNL